VGKPVGKLQLGRWRRKWCSNIKVDLGEMCYWRKVNGSDSQSYPMVGFGVSGVESIVSAADTRQFVTSTYNIPYLSSITADWLALRLHVREVTGFILSP
jgi:hypothetical protein